MTVPRCARWGRALVTVTVTGTFGEPCLPTLDIFTTPQCKLPLDVPRDSPNRPKRPDTDAFVAWLETLPNPVERYHAAKEALEAHQEAVRRLSAVRASALADAAEEDSVSGLARTLGVSRQRAHQLIREAKERAQAAAPEKRGRTRKGKKR